MKHLKPFILESKNIGVLYHFTTYSSAIQILSNFKLKATEFEEDSEETDNFLHVKYPFRISFTRNKFLWKIITDEEKMRNNILFDVCVVFDGNKLSNKYKIKSYDDNYKKSSTNIPIKRVGTFGNEQEERLYTKENYIEINNTLIEVIIYINNIDKLKDNSANTSRINTIINICKDENIKYKIYLKDTNETIENI